ncbi:CHAT domain-containing protein [Rosistilla oblonga]|uniref:CHAT domain protein n=1 Tax=Rosistilla oblonga TaxID=2527990 RepID=A0A518ISS3_9BACT|nr:CHAT domain-containing protein [Rosistilla oblonga]QDV56103.1 CHAT domain protein [Rosistilla oblonga]
MTTNVRPWIPVLCGGLLLTMFTPARAQNSARTYPPQQYYVGLAALREGALPDAVDLFESAIRSGRTDPSGKWIDSIPAYAMLGECNYQLGKLPLAHQNFDAAIGLMLRHSGWLESVQWPQSLAGVKAPLNAGSWASSGRRTTLANIPNTMQIMMGSQDVAGQIQSGGTLQTAQLMKVDVTEIVRSLAWAVYRRSQVLGGLSIDDPLNESLLTSLGRTNLPAGPGPAWIDLIRAIALIADNQPQQAVGLVDRSATLQGGFDHQLTPIALLVGANLLLINGQPKATTQYVEAAISASAFGQYEIAAEAMRIAVGPLASQGSGALTGRANAAGLQMARKSRLMAATSYLVAAESAANSGQPRDAQRSLADARSILSRRNTVLPRLEAYANYCLALTAFQKGDTKAAAVALDKVMVFALNDAPATCPHTYQLTIVQNAMAGGGIGGRTADELLTALSSGPSLGQWLIDPVNALSATRPHQAVDQMRFSGLIQRRKYEEALQVADEVLGNRFRAQLPLSGRMLDVRWLLSAPKDHLSAAALEVRDKPTATLKAISALATLMSDHQTTLAGMPFEAADAPQATQLQSNWTELATAADRAETLVGQAAVQRMKLPRVFPPAIGDKSMWPQLTPGHAVVTFCPAGPDLIGMLYTNGNVTAWPVQRPASLLPQISQWVKTLGVVRRRGGAAQLSTPDQWQPIAQSLRQQVFAGIPPETLTSIKRLVIVPYGTLWYLPFQLLPMEDPKGPMMGDAISISYAPTPGLALNPPALSQNKILTGAIAGRFLSPTDAELNDQLSQELIDAVADTERLPGQANLPGALIAPRFGRVWVAAPIKPNPKAPLSVSPFAYDQSKPGGDLASWIRFPWGGPGELLMPGFQSGISTAGGAVNGDEMFMMACGLQASGAKQVLMSRWAVGGQSTASLLREYLGEVEFSSPLDSWRRSVVLLRNQELDPSTEPLLSDGDIKAGPASGSNPLFWSGYLMIGADIERRP